MTKNLPRQHEMEGTRNLMVGASAAAALLLVGALAWLAVPSLLGTTDYVGRPSTGADSKTAATALGTGVPTQREAQSSAAKNDPAGSEDSTGGRARKIMQSSEGVSLTPDERQKLRAVLSSSTAPRMDRANFELMVGTSVPRQTELADLPPEATQILNGYWGDQCLIAGHDLIVIDHSSRRVAAIISGVD
jgi:hypothetical protein